MTTYDSADPNIPGVLEARVFAENPVRADVIVWLQGNRYDRGPKVLALYRSGYAPTILLTGNDVRGDDVSAVDGVIVRVTDLERWLCAHGVPSSAIIRDVQSFHTRDQAVQVFAIVHKHGWQRLLLVASPHHQLRAFLTFLKRAQELEWTGRIVNQPAEIPWDTIPSGRTDTSRELQNIERAKLYAYATHTATIADALRYFECV